MKVLMIEISTAKNDGDIPFGVLYAASSARRSGHDVRIIDLVKEDFSYADIKGHIEDFSPDIIGMGGITSGYRNCKELTANIKKDFKEMPVVVGGVISSVSDLLLRSANVDFVVHGEGEVSFPGLIDAIGHRRDASEIKGISFLKSGKIYRTAPQPQIGNLDDIPMPDWSLLNIENYLEPAENWINWFFAYEPDELRRLTGALAGKKVFSIVTSRGCTHRCIFCYRHQAGLRQHSTDYVVRMMRHCRDKYNAGIFKIVDELTTANRQWVMRLCDSIIRERLGIFFLILSSRVDTVDEEVLRKLKDAGCLMINYGYESGSDTILKEIRKGVTRKAALEAGILTKKVGMKNVPEIIVGFPSETKNTVNETISFLKQLDTWPISINTPIPFPETPLWDRGVERGLIKDKEDFVLGYKRNLFVNFTKYPDRTVLKFVDKVMFDVKLHWALRKKKYGLYAKWLIEKLIIMYLKPMMPKRVYDGLRKIYRVFFQKDDACVS